MIAEDWQQFSFLDDSRFFPIRDNAPLEVKFLDPEEDIRQAPGLHGLGILFVVWLPLRDCFLKIAKEELLGSVLVIEDKLARPLDIGSPESLIQKGKNTALSPSPA